MRISELIEQLEDIRAEHGNLQLRTFDDYECMHDVTGVHVRVNDAGAKSWETDGDLGDGEVYASIS